MFMASSTKTISGFSTVNKMLISPAGGVDESEGPVGSSNKYIRLLQIVQMSCSIIKHIYLKGIFQFLN